MFDTEKFICEIEARPALYNVKSKDYSNRDVKAKCWYEVGHEMYEDWESPELSSQEKDVRVKDLMKKWKTLRDAFVKDHRSAMAPGTGKAASAKKRYVYYEQLQFILPYVKGNPNTASNITPPAPTTPDATNNDAEPDDVTTTPNNDSTNVTNETPVTQNPSNKRKNDNPNVVAGKRAALERSVANSAKELTSILAANLQMQREERTSDKYGHRAFLLSFLPVLENIPFQESMILRGQISQVITNHFANNEVPSRSNSSVFSAPQTPASDMLSETSEDTVFDISQYIKL